MKRTALFLALLLLAGCDVQSKDRSKGEDKVSIHANANGQVSFDLPIAQGQLKIPGGIMHGDNFDIDGVKLMPGSSVTSFDLDSHRNRSTINVGFNSPSPPDQVRSYFVEQFKHKGVDASLSGEAITGRSKDGDPFTVQVSAAEGGSAGTIVVQSTN